VTPEEKQRLSRVCHLVLETLSKGFPELIWAAISTRDGIEIASVGEGVNEKLSVMAGTMHALAGGIVSEAALGECRDIILDATEGRIAVLSIEGGANDLVFAGMANRETSLGLLVSRCSAVAQAIGSALVIRLDEHGARSSLG